MIGNLDVVSSLHAFMNKFHFIFTGQTDQITKMKVEELSKQANKVIIFQDVKSYSDKIKNALAGA